MFGDPSIQFPAPFHIRNVTSVLAFFLFLFSPPPNDLLLLVSSGLSAALAALAASVSPLRGLSGAVGAASVAMAGLAIESKISGGTSASAIHPGMTSGFFFVPYSPSGSAVSPSSLTSEGVRDETPVSDHHRVTWTIGGLAIAATGGMAVAGVLWNFAQAAEKAVDALRVSRRVPLHERRAEPVERAVYMRPTGGETPRPVRVSVQTISVPYTYACVDASTASMRHFG